MLCRVVPPVERPAAVDHRGTGEAPDVPDDTEVNLPEFPAVEVVAEEPG